MLGKDLFHHPTTTPWEFLLSAARPTSNLKSKLQYARVTLNHRPPIEGANKIQITAEGNLINYPGELTTRTADVTMLKLH
jgi:hypothetical protein